MTDGDTTVVTHWDGEGYPHFWTIDNLIVNYWGEDAAVINLLDAVIGQPLADRSQPHPIESTVVAPIGITLEPQ